MPNRRRLILTILVTILLLLNCSSISDAQVNPPQSKEQVTVFNLATTLSRLWAALLNFLTFGSRTPIITPVPLGEVKGVNPQPLPLLDDTANTTYPYQAQGEKYQLNYTFGTGGVSTPPTEGEEETPPPKPPSQTAKSTGEALGQKVDQTAKEINGWAKDTNVMTLLIFLSLGVMMAIVFLLLKFVGKRLLKRRTITTAGLLIIIALPFTILPPYASAYSNMNSASYQLQDYDLTQGGGKGTSNSYILQQAVGQAFQGSKGGASYIIYEGIMYYSGILSLVCADATVNIPLVTPGSPQSTTSTCTVTTDAATGYLLYASENKNLEHTTEAGTYITPANLGSYASPTPWSTASSLGLGFSLSGASVQSKWNSGGNFSSFVSASPGQINSYATAAAGGTNITFTYKLDVNNTQQGGTYSNAVSYYATAVIFQ